jgi:hypothetical protein
MPRRRSTSTSRIQSNHNPGDICQNNQIIRPISELYKQAYQSLMNTECYQNNVHQNTHVSARRSIPPPHLNNLKPVNSPMNSPARRPHSPSETDLSELDDFVQNPNSKTINNVRKKPKTKTNDINNKQHIDIATTTSTNLTTTSTNQQPVINATVNKLSDEAKVFAQSRYPFPPFILRFSTPHIHEQKIVDDLCKSLKDNVHVDLELSGFRKAATKCSSNECDLLLFVKNSHSFSILFDEKNWPQTILGLTFTRPSTPSIPPQLSLIVKNVSLSIDFVNFTNEIKTTYPKVSNVIRMKNKNQMNIKLVKLEFCDHAQRDEILNRGKIFVNSLTFDIDEYLAPARVLICSKCMGIGHFRKQCKQEQDTCKKCGINFDDINNHTATCTQLHCKHCQGDHMSNDMKCPIVKQFRADLTKFLLSPAIHANHQHNNFDFTSTNFPPMNPAQRTSLYKHGDKNKDIIKNNNEYYLYDGEHRNHPSNPNPYNWSSNTGTTSSVVNKIDDLINSMNQVNVLLEKLVNKNDQFEQFMKDKTSYDVMIANKIDDVIKNENAINLITAQHEIKITRHENLFTKLVFPLLEEISTFLSNINSGKHGGTLDADFKVTINRMRAQLNNAKISKDF